LLKACWTPLRSLGPVELTTLPGVAEDIEFKLPAELNGVNLRRLSGEWHQFKEHVHWEIPILQMAQIGAYVVRQRLAGRKALSARPDARTLVPLQSRLRGLRQDRLPRQDLSISACRPPIASRRSMNAMRPSS